MLIIRGVNVFPTQIEEQILKIAALAPHYEIVVYRDGNLDCVDIRVELKPDANASDAETCQRIAKELQHHIKSVVGISTHVKVCNSGLLPRSEGKATRVFDKRK